MEYGDSYCVQTNDADLIARVNDDINMGVGYLEAHARQTSKLLARLLECGVVNRAMTTYARAETEALIQSALALSRTANTIKYFRGMRERIPLGIIHAQATD